MIVGTSMNTINKEIIENAPSGATHYNFNGTTFPYEKHGKKDIYVWANGKWELTNIPSCAVPLVA